MRHVAIIAHRGASAIAPENSLEAFAKAVELGADMVEMDVRTTLDGIPVIMHDETVDRTTDGSGRLPEMTLEALRGLELRNSEQVPTLIEALDALKGKCRVNIELKDARAAVRSFSIVREMGMVDAAVFSSFDCGMLSAVRSGIPGARLAVISDDKRSGFIRAAVGIGAAAVNLSGRIVAPKVIDDAHGNGLAVNVWTVNRADRMRKFAAMGVDGIITDRPDALARALAAGFEGKL